MNPIQRSIWLLGDPVSHSVSPQLHNHVYQKHQLPFVYLLARVPKEFIQEGLQALTTLGAAGANLTIPHKQVVIPFLTSLSPAAKAIGAVNCIRPMAEQLQAIPPATSGLSPRGWEGHNTDAQGWLDSWNQEISEPLEGRRCIVLGSGGTSRSIVWALGQAGATDIHLLARNPAKFQILADGPHCQTGRLDELPNLLDPGCVVINCTSVGMSPNLEDCPIEWPNQLPPKTVAVDVIYNPAETKFLKTAREKGARVLNGSGMLVHQALRAMDFFSNSDLSSRCDASELRMLLEKSLQGR